MYIKEYEMSSRADYCGRSQELVVTFVLDKDSKFDPSNMKGRVAIIPSEGVVRETKEQVAAKLYGVTGTKGVIGTVKPVSKDDILNDKKFAEMVQAACDKELARKMAENNFRLEYEKCERNQEKFKTVKPSSNIGHSGGFVAKPIPDLYPYQKEMIDKLVLKEPSTIFYSSPSRHGKQFATEYSSKFDFNPVSESNMTNMTPHSARTEGRNLLNVSGSRLTGTLKLEDEVSTLRVEIPGVEPSRVEVKRIDSLLRIRVKPELADLEDEYGFQKDAPVRELNLILTDEEDVTDVNVALGVLEISIDRGREVQDFEVNAAE